MWRGELTRRGDNSPMLPDHEKCGRTGFTRSFPIIDSLPVHLLELLVEFVRPRPGENALPGRRLKCLGTAAPGLCQSRILRGDPVGPDQLEKAILYRGRLACDGQSLADRPEY